MSLNKNSIFAWSSFILTLLGITLILLGVLKYPEYAIGFSVVGNTRVNLDLASFSDDIWSH